MGKTTKSSGKAETPSSADKGIDAAPKAAKMNIAKEEPKKGKEPKASGKKSTSKEPSTSSMPTKSTKPSKEAKKKAPMGGVDSATEGNSIAAGLVGGLVSSTASALFTVTGAVSVAPPKLSIPAKPANDDNDSDSNARGRKRKAKATSQEGGDGKKAKNEEGEEDEPLTPRRPVDPEREKRTVFVGNVPVSIKKPAIKTIFRPYGDIESIRFRSVTLADPHIPKKVGYITKKFHPERSAMNAYVVFKTTDAARAALAANCTLLDGKHITCDIAANKEHDTRHTVFVGGLPFNTEDEALREHFGQCGDIHSVRVVRDKKTGIGKGIAYIRFQDASSVGLAERLHGTEYGGKQIRVMKAVDEQTLLRQKAKKEKKSYQGERTKSSKSGKKAGSAKVLGHGSKKSSNKNKGHKPPKKKGLTGGQMQKKMEAKKRKMASKKG